MIRVLAIGNSFSKDATRYLHAIAESSGDKLQVYNLCIGGCALERHFRLMRTGAPEYGFEFNGESTDMHVSLQQMLGICAWDYVTLQQASHFSFDYDTYQPYLNELAAFIRSYVPKTKLMIHQTWAYEQGSARLQEMAGYTDQGAMFRDVEAAYDRAAKDVQAAGIIPSGALFQRMLKNGFDTVHRDTFHAHLGYGRYALGALWYEMLTGNNVEGNAFRQLDVPSEDVDFAKLQRLVHETATEYGKTHRP